MNIERPELIARLERFVTTGSGIVVGRPGVGKTHSILKVRERLSQSGVPHLLLPVDELGSGTQEELEAALSFEGDLLDRVRLEFERKARTPGVLLFDAFDAARSEDIRERFLALIRRAVWQSEGRWHVTVTVREYDARKSASLLEMFGPSDGYEENSDPRIGCRHFVIPALTDSEVEQAIGQIPALAPVYERASADLKALARVPFNLWLLERILHAAGPVPDFSVIRSEVQLLDLFWERRVLASETADERELLLTRLLRLLTKERVVSARREAVYDASGRRAWLELHSEEVLSESGWAEQRVAFSHNILFDYGVGRLLMDDDPQSLVSFVAEDASRPLFLRPSLVYHFTALWHRRPTAFWRNVWALIGSDELHIRLVARLIPPAVIATEARDPFELAPLFDGAAKAEPLARELMLRLLQVLRLMREGRAGLWAEVCRKASESLDRQFAWELTTLITDVLESAGEAERESVRFLAGEVGRRALSWVLDLRKGATDPWADALGAIWAVPLVARTSGTNVPASRALLTRVLELCKEEDFPIQYMFRLAHAVEHIVPHDPQFAGDVYRTIFAHVEESRKETSFGTPVLPLRSTRRQDFQMCQYELKQQFPNFLKSAPVEAAKAAVDCVNLFVLREHVSGYRTQEAEALNPLEFSFRGKSARYVGDTSYIWEVGARREDIVELAEELFRYIEENAEGDPDIVDALLDVLSERTIVALLWRELLRIGARKPQFLAQKLFELSVAKPVQTGPDTLYELGSFLAAATAFFTEEQRAQLEGSLFDLPSNAPEDDRELLCRDRLLACIPLEHLTSEQARERRRELEASGSVPENRPLSNLSTYSKEYTEADWFEERGVDLEKPENRALQDHFERLKSFASSWQNKIPTPQAISEFLPSALEAREAIASHGNADKDVLTSAWTKLAAVAESMSRAAPKLGDREFNFCKRVLLEASSHEAPQPSPTDKFDFPAWSPAPRHEAAQGLPWLAMARPDDALLTGINRLIHDEVPSVRFLVVQELFRLRWGVADSFWNYVDDVSRHEQNRVVLAALCRTLASIPLVDHERIASVLDRLHRRGVIPAVRSDLSDGFVGLAVRLALHHRTKWAVDLLDTFVRAPSEHGSLLRQAVFVMLTAVTPDYLDKRDTRHLARGAIDWLSSVLDVLRTEVRLLRSRAAEAPSDNQDRLGTLYEAFHEIVSRLYYNAALGEKARRKGGVTEAQRREYYENVKPLLKQAVSFGTEPNGGVILAPTAHHFMELMNGVLNYDPAGVIHMAADVAGASERGGYNLDSLAIREVVQLVEAVLADHRAVVREGEPLSDLLRLLDVFAKAGWPEALRLVWRLDEVFR